MCFPCRVSIRASSGFGLESLGRAAGQASPLPPVGPNRNACRETRAESRTPPRWRFIRRPLARGARPPASADVRADCSRSSPRIGEPPKMVVGAAEARFHACLPSRSPRSVLPPFPAWERGRDDSRSSPAPVAGARLRRAPPGAGPAIPPDRIQEPRHQPRGQRHQGDGGEKAENNQRVRSRHGPEFPQRMLQPGHSQATMSSRHQYKPSPAAEPRWPRRRPARDPELSPERLNRPGFGGGSRGGSERHLAVTARSVAQCARPQTPKRGRFGRHSEGSRGSSITAARSSGPASSISMPSAW